MLQHFPCSVICVATQKANMISAYLFVFISCIPQRKLLLFIIHNSILKYYMNNMCQIYYLHKASSDHGNAWIFQHAVLPLIKTIIMVIVLVILFLCYITSSSNPLACQLRKLNLVCRMHKAAENKINASLCSSWRGINVKNF